jgi:proliferating cell nuclear antigen
MAQETETEFKTEQLEQSEIDSKSQTQIIELAESEGILDGSWFNELSEDEKAQKVESLRKELKELIHKTHFDKRQEIRKEKERMENMPEFDIKQSGTNDLKTFFALGNSVNEELTINIDQECLSLRTMDPSHVALIDIVFGNTGFEKYEVKKDGKFAIRADEVNNLLKTFDKKDSLSLSVSDSSNIKFNTKTTAQKLRLIETSGSECPLPHLNHNAKATINLKDFKNIVKRIKTVSDYISFEMNEKVLEISGRGDSGESTITLEKGIDYMTDFELRDASEISHSTYAIEYIEKFLRCLGECSSITLNFSTKMPVRIDANLNNTNYARINYYLAPRVEN